MFDLPLMNPVMFFCPFFLFVFSLFYNNQIGLAYFYTLLSPWHNNSIKFPIYIEKQASIGDLFQLIRMKKIAFKLFSFSTFYCSLWTK